MPRQQTAELTIQLGEDIHEATTCRSATPEQAFIHMGDVLIYGIARELEVLSRLAHDAAVKAEWSVSQLDLLEQADALADLADERTGF